jgi:DNA modification methylase
LENRWLLHYQFYRKNQYGICLIVNNSLLNKIDCYHNDKTRHEQKVFSVNNVGGENNRKEQGNHPTPKPITLVVQIIDEIAKKSNSILDLFLGSGTTMLASHQLKRKCYGMELDPKYCDVIVKRMIKLDSNLKIKRNGVDETKKWLDKIN